MKRDESRTGRRQFTKTNEFEEVEKKNNNNNKLIITNCNVIM